MSTIIALLRARQKAIVAAVVGTVTQLAAQHGLDLSDAQAATLTTVVTALFVYLVPNKQ